MSICIYFLYIFFFALDGIAYVKLVLHLFCPCCLKRHHLFLRGPTPIRQEAVCLVQDTGSWLWQGCAWQIRLGNQVTALLSFLSPWKRDLCGHFIPCLCFQNEDLEAQRGEGPGLDLAPLVSQFGLLSALQLLLRFVLHSLWSCLRDRLLFFSVSVNMKYICFAFQPCLPPPPLPTPPPAVCPK